MIPDLKFAEKEITNKQKKESRVYSTGTNYHIAGLLTLMNLQKERRLERGKKKVKKQDID